MPTSLLPIPPLPSPPAHPQEEDAARCRADAQKRQAHLEGRIKQLRQSMAAVEEARVARKEAVRLELEGKLLEKEMEVQVRPQGDK